MTVNLSALGGAGQQFFDNNGNPLSGGKLYSYEAGTTTPQTTYTSVSGATAHTNPIVLDSAGRVSTGEIWLTSSQNYKFVLKTSAEVTIATWDNITGINGTGIATNADNVEYDPPFTGALTSGYTVENKLGQYMSVKDFGATGDGTTDDTAAIQAAIDYLGSIISWPVSTSRGRLRPALYFPAGVYKVSSSITISYSSLVIFGDGPLDSLVAWYGGNTPVFDIGTFSTTPADIFLGPQDHWFTNIRIQHSSPGTAGSRSGQGIRTSGGGGLRLNNVSVLGFAYGINSPYGGDFNNYYSATAETCDVGFYQGPGGQQFYTNSLNAYLCVEGFVMDRCGQGEHDLFIGNSPATACVVIEAPSATTTRQLASFPAGGTSLQSQIVFNSPWFEGNAGGLGDAFIPTNFIYCNNSGGDAYRDITINDPIVVAGATGTKTTTSFWSNNGTGAQRVRINNLVFFGEMTRFFTNPQGIVMDGYRVTTGYTAPAFANDSAYQINENGLRSQTYRSAITGNQQYFVNADSTLGVRTTYGDDSVTFGFSNAGTWVDRFGFDIQDARLFLSDPATNGFSIGRSASVPTSGTYAIGSFVYNTAPSVSGGKTLLGWQRLTTGSGHVLNTDWSPCYVTNT